LSARAARVSRHAAVAARRAARRGTPVAVHRVELARAAIAGRKTDDGCAVTRKRGPRPTVRCAAAQPGVTHLRARDAVRRRRHVAGARVDRREVREPAVREIGDGQGALALTLARNAHGDVAVSAVVVARILQPITARPHLGRAALEVHDDAAARVIGAAGIDGIDALCSYALATWAVGPGEPAVRPARIGERHDQHAPRNEGGDRDDRGCKALNWHGSPVRQSTAPRRLATRRFRATRRPCRHRFARFCWLARS
jgi:hypothetical protein